MLWEALALDCYSTRLRSYILTFLAVFPPILVFPVVRIMRIIICLSAFPVFR